jgi:hypothetical protein
MAMGCRQRRQAAEGAGGFLWSQLGRSGSDPNVREMDKGFADAEFDTPIIADVIAMER